jgi:hypothetical protein
MLAALVIWSSQSDKWHRDAPSVLSVLYNYFIGTNLMNRETLQSQLIQQTLDDMDLKTVMSVLYDFMNESYSNYSDAEITEEVEEYYPDLLDSDPDESTGWN